MCHELICICKKTCHYGIQTRAKNVACCGALAGALRYTRPGQKICELFRAHALYLALELSRGKVAGIVWECLAEGHTPVLAPDAVPCTPRLYKRQVFASGIMLQMLATC
jgi:hypothetical protein